MLGTCLWFGLAAGLAERLLYVWFPGTVGGNDLWYAAWADLLFFLAIGIPVLLIGLFAWRARLLGVTVFLCAALLALDCLVVAWPPFGHRAWQMALLSGGALLAAALVTVLFTRFSRQLAALLRVTLLPLVVYAVLYLGGGVWWARHQERREAAALHAAPGSPNVLLIIMDAVGANHLSTYGYSRNTSPHLSELAARGLLFERAVAPSSWTLPSHASMLTGRLPSEH
ncbi:MAG TPA: sulfatase-like hydrolase/transferase, partial [Terriglobales bacterium]|nr:sulfatase-like hydrolase/transferase [Terriglobales bacterium]